MKRLIFPFLLALFLIPPIPRTAYGQCEQAQPGSVTIYLFDFKSPDIPQDKLNKFLDVLTFKLNNGIRENLKSRGLLGKASFFVRWCSGYPVTEADAAVKNGKQLNSPGVLWGFIDQSSGQLKSSTRLTALTDKPVTDNSTIVYDREGRELVDDSYIAFASFILGKIHLQRRDMVLARKCFTYARDLKGLPELLKKDLNESYAALDQTSSASKLTAVGKGAK